MKRILVIDDDESIRHWLTEYLVDLGYKAEIAVDGDHGIRSAVALLPDLILLDVHVPQPAVVLRFADAYRERVPAGRRAPIIAISAGNDLEALAQQIGAPSAPAAGARAPRP